MFELATADAVFFLKFPAKNFTDSVEPVAQAAVRVVQEWAAWECLRRSGVPAVEVVTVEEDAENPVGWPYLLTRALPGKPLTDILQRRSSTWREAIAATGAYLAATHALRFERPGFILTPEGPAPDPALRPPLPVHDPMQEQASALRDLERARPQLDHELATELETRFATIAETIAADYEHPRFVHAAFHINHPYIDESPAGVAVTGSVDMDSASAGASFDDLTTVAAGMMVRTRRLRWWEPFFDAYGRVDFERFRLALLATCFYCFGEETAQQDVASTYRALLAAETWDELFTANQPSAPSRPRRLPHA